MRQALLAEGLGSMLLAAAVIGSGIMAERIAVDGAVALLANTFATVAALAVLIAMLAPISGAHFNPAVSLIAVLDGRLPKSRLAAYAIVQIAGCCLGAMLAHAMYELPLIQVATHARNGFAQLLSEVVATAGLVLVVLSCSSSREALWRVPAWIAAAYWFTASTSFANPAIAVGRALSDTFSGIAPADAPGFIAAQFAGALLGFLTARVLRTQAAAVPQGSEIRAPSASE